jgi:hypothetical protein
MADIKQEGTEELMVLNQVETGKMMGDAPRRHAVPLLASNHLVGVGRS